MHYQPEELIPVVALLARRYTGGESTSVSYETAEQLMGAVCYCIDAYEKSTAKDVENATEHAADGPRERTAVTDILESRAVSPMEAWERGRELVAEEVRRTIALYNQLIRQFDAYGNRAYRDTMEAIPSFFLRYDVWYRPQDHLLLLDYPVPSLPESLCGVYRIHAFLTCVEKEQRFLSQFPRERVIEILRRYHPEYEELIFNLPEAIFLFNTDGSRESPVL